MKKTLAIACAFLQLGALESYAQQSLLAPEPGHTTSSWPSIARPYDAPVIPPIRLANSSRLHDLIRAGILYLTAQEAIALAIENNFDLEIQRYEPLLAEWNVQRQEGGGALRGANNNSAQVGAVASGQGVIGTLISAGLASSSGGGGGGGGGNNQIQQVGITAPNYDWVLSNSTTFSHVTIPQPVESVSQVPELIDNVRAYQTQAQVGLPTGGGFRISQTEDYLDENSPGDQINPSMAPQISAVVYQRFFQGMGLAVNTYYIKEAKNNVRAAQESFRAQLLALTASVLNLYWNLVSATEAVKAAQQALDIAQKFDNDTHERVRLGTLAGYQTLRADEELSRQRQLLSLAQMQEQQSEEPLKNAISRSVDPLLESAKIVPLDRIDVPAEDTLPPLRDMISRAMETRPDLIVAKINDENAGIRAVGTENPLLPSSYAFAQTWNAGVAGSLGTAFGQVMKRDFPSQYAGASISAPLNNRFAQADYGIDQLQLQQTALRSQKNRNQIAAEISNQVVALKQAHAGYAASVSARELQEQLLSAEQDKFSFGSSTIDNLVLTQRALVAAQTAEITAKGAYAHARLALDQALGRTLEVNRVVFEEAESGVVSAKSAAPSDSAPAPASPSR